MARVTLRSVSGAEYDVTVTAKSSFAARTQAETMYPWLQYVHAEKVA